jgi:DNA-directed RNA polymerase subunit H (RpoH/RPB5)
MEAILQVMLAYRGIKDLPTTVEGLEGKLNKYGPILVWNTGKKSVTPAEIDAFLAKLEETASAQGILIIKTPPSPNTMKRIRKESAKLQIFYEDQLQFDLMKHRKVSPHRILPAEERDAFLTKYNIQEPSTQMPFIDSQDAVGRWIGAKPGDVVEVLRRSESSGISAYYRYCVADVTM